MAHAPASHRCATIAGMRASLLAQVLASACARTRLGFVRARACARMSGARLELEQLVDHVDPADLRRPGFSITPLRRSAHATPRAHPHTHTHTNPRTHTNTHTHARTHMPTHAHTRAHTHAHTHTHTCARAHTHANTHAHTHTHTHTHTLSNTHTHTRKHTHARKHTERGLRIPCAALRRAAAWRGPARCSRSGRRGRCACTRLPTVGHRASGLANYNGLPIHGLL
jgi:hypothetical protein